MNNCLQCGALSRNPKYCSHSCRATFLNKMLIKKNARPRVICKCGAAFYASKGSNKTFCSAVCHQRSIYDKYIEDWLAGRVSGGSKSGVSNFVRKFLRIKQNGQCHKCKKSSWMEQPIPLELEHKDGNHKNNTPNNVCLLCPNCHSQTDTYGSKNRGQGRSSRSSSSHETLTVMRLASKVIVSAKNS